MGNSLNTNIQPRIYVVCLAAYNNGYLHGAWISAAQEPWSIYDDVKAMLAASPIAGAEPSTPTFVTLGHCVRRASLPYVHGYQTIDISTLLIR